MFNSKISMIFLFIILTISCKSESQTVTAQKKEIQSGSASKKMVLAELFTSEGCSSCPPAEKALAFFEEHQPIAGVEIIGLAFHIDYWDYIGWKDIYAQAPFTQRQNNYAQVFRLGSIYTPQMIIDGKHEFVGSDTKKAVKFINEALKEEKAKIEISQKDEKISIKIEELPKHEVSTVYLAIAENNLSSNVKSGENSGQQLQHQAVVRELKALTFIPAEKNSLETEAGFQLKTEWKKENLKFVVFVQENNSRKILGLSQLKN